MPNFSHLFRQDSNDQYLFCGNLGDGADGFAQLVLHVPSNRPFVRKTRSPRLLERKMHSPINRKEVTHLRYLQQWNIQEGGHWPNIVRLRAYEDIPPGKHGDRPFHVLYLDYYNGGDLGQLHTYLQLSGVRIPRLMVVRLAKQMLHALGFMYSCDPPVFHLDLTMPNIFLDWKSDDMVDFYLGDFGFSAIDQIADTDMHSRSDLTTLCGIIKTLRDLVSEKNTENPDDFDMLEDIIREIYDISHDDNLARNTPPDIQMLLHLVDKTRDPTKAERQAWRELNHRDAHRANVTPTSYDTEQECLVPPVAVHGPWHVAQVLIPGIEAPTVLSYGQETYHRPFGGIVDSDSAEE